MRESELHEQIYKQAGNLGSLFPGLIVGPGDDCAVVQDGDTPLLLKVDQVISGRHFLPYPQTSIDLIARKALARPLSDIAAMGGTPKWALVAGILPPTPHSPYASELCERLDHWGRVFRCPVVGGDIATGSMVGPQSQQSPPALSLSVTIVGEVNHHRGPVLRSTACVGDEIWMTGTLGGSLKSGRHLTFTPRVSEAQWLAKTLGEDLHAMMDISDGLGRDVGRLAKASGVHAILESTRLPLSDGLTDPVQAASDGEDYELVFCVASGSLDGHAQLAPCPLTRIGKIEAGAGCVLQSPNSNALIDASALGWEHS